jgi:hypothetical protein
MKQPETPNSLPKYLAEDIPKQDDQTLEELQEYLSELIEYRNRAISEDEIPSNAKQVGGSQYAGKGTVVTEKVKCGDSSCKCTKGGEKHGPYVYRYFRRNGSLESEYLGKPSKLNINI